MKITIDSNEDGGLFQKVLGLIGGSAPDPTPSSAPAAAATPAAPTGPTLEDAIAKATEVVGAGNPQFVKTALAKASPGTAKVRELPAEHVAGFLQALEETISAADSL